MIPIDLEELRKFPIRMDNCDMANGSEDYVLGIETVLEYAENIPVIRFINEGFWIPHNPKRHNSVYAGLFKCSECGKWVGSCTNYCSFCGSKNS